MNNLNKPNNSQPMTSSEQIKKLEAELAVLNAKKTDANAA